MFDLNTSCFQPDMDGSNPSFRNRTQDLAQVINNIYGRFRTHLNTVSGISKEPNVQSKARSTPRSTILIHQKRPWTLPSSSTPTSQKPGRVPKPGIVCISYKNEIINTETRTKIRRGTHSANGNQKTSTCVHSDGTDGNRKSLDRIEL
jgi:hypothetical protein